MNRITLLIAICFMVIFIIFVRLFFLQVIKASYYQQIAFEKNQGYTEIPARRGEIMIQDRNSDEPYSLATNTTFKLVYADPTLIENPTYIGGILAPLLFDLEEEQERDQERYENLLKEYEDTFETIEEMEPVDTDEESEEEPEIDLEELLSYTDLKLHTDEELFILFEQELIATLSEKTRSVILLGDEFEPEVVEDLENIGLTGIEVTENGTLYAYPSQISDKESTAKKLAEILSVDRDNLESVLLGRNRYVILKRKLPHSVSQEIEDLMSEEEKEFFGIRLQEEYYRYYPEGELGAQLLGYVNSAGNG